MPPELLRTDTRGSGRVGLAASFDEFEAEFDVGWVVEGEAAEDEVAAVEACDYVGKKRLATVREVREGWEKPYDALNGIVASGCPTWLGTLGPAVSSGAKQGTSCSSRQPVSNGHGTRRIVTGHTDTS